MAEERSCEMCRFSMQNNVIGESCWLRGISGCISYSKWQPITKPKVQHTKEEWASIVDDLDWNPDVMVELEQKGYICKSELVKLVEEAEGEHKKWLTRTDDNMSETMVMDKFNKALQALKKDHPEFGGKK